ncbi:MAG: hypothetical protein ACR2HR_11590 [Euzebya sp.]
MTTTSVGTAAPGWPASGAARDDDRLYVVSRNTDQTRVAEIDIFDFSLLRQRTLPAGDGAWGVTLAPDGVYAGLFGARGSGNLYRLTASSSTAVAQLAVDYIWDLTAGGDGTVYGVAGQPSLVFRYSPSTGTAHNIGLLSGNQRPRTCTLLGTRLVVGGNDAGQAYLVDRSVAGGSTRDLLPSALTLDDTVYCSATTADGRVVIGTAGRELATPAMAVIDASSPDAAIVVRLPREALVDTVAVDGDAVFATARPSGGLYRLDLGSRRLFRLDVPVPMSETRDLSVVGQHVIGASADGSVWRYNRNTDSSTVVDPHSLGLGLHPQRAQSICAASTHVDVGGSFSITRHNLATGTTATRFVPGEPKALVDVDGTTYFAIYPIGEVWVWRPGAVGPSRLTQLDSDQTRPIAMAYLAQFDALVCTTTDDLTRSVLNTIDAVTGRVDKVVNPLGSQSVAGVTTNGGTIYVGGSGNAPAVAAFDATSGARLWTLPNIIPGGGFVLGLQVVAGRLAISTSRGWFTTVELGSLSVATAVQLAALGGQLRARGSNVLLATGDSLLRINPTTRVATPLETNLAGQHWNWPPMDTDPSGRAWLMRGRDLVHN